VRPQQRLLLLLLLLCVLRPSTHGPLRLLSTLALLLQVPCKIDKVTCGV
jgi:hypothetical protein